MDRLTAEQIEELERLEKAATRGPWGYEAVENECGVRYQHIFAGGGDNPSRGAGVIDTYHADALEAPMLDRALGGTGAGTIPPTHGKAANAAFVVAIRNHAPALLSLARRAEQAETSLVGVAIQVLGFDDEGEPIAFDDAKVTEAINRLLRAEAEVERLREALEECDVAMDTAVMLGVESVLGGRDSVYAEQWRETHLKARAALRPADANKETDHECQLGSDD